jgi:hypothetical protein
MEGKEIIMSKWLSILNWTEKIGVAASQGTPLGPLVKNIDDAVRKPTPLGGQSAGSPIVNTSPSAKPRDVAVGMTISNLPAVLSLLPAAGEGATISGLLTHVTNEFEIYLRQETQDTEDEVEQARRLGKGDVSK